MKLNKWKRTLPAVLALGLLTACAAKTEKSGTFLSAPESVGRVVIDTNGFSDVTPTRVHFFDRMEKEEYTLYRSGVGQTEILFAETRPDIKPQVVLDFDKLSSDTVKMWRFNQGKPLKFAESYAINNRITQFWITTYVQADTGRECFGFNGTWDIRYDDKEFRPSKVLFGYHCAPTGKPLAPGDPERIVQALDIRGVTVPLRLASAYDAGKEPERPPRQQQVAQLVIAQDGIGGGTAGLPDFPLLIARTFRDTDGPCVSC